MWQRIYQGVTHNPCLYQTLSKPSPLRGGFLRLMFLPLEGELEGVS